MSQPKEKEECPECLAPVDAEELEMFGGVCEECCLNEDATHRE